MTTRIPDKSVSIIIFSDGVHETLRNCLEHVLESTLDRVELMVVCDALPKITQMIESEYPMVKLLISDLDSGPRVFNQTAKLANSEVLVILDSNTVVFDGWLDELISHFKYGSVVAVGPRSESAAKDQNIDINASDVAGFDSTSEFAYAWRMAHTGQTTLANRLDKFCVAIRRSAFVSVGGFEESYETINLSLDDFFMKFLNLDDEVLIANGCYVQCLSQEGQSAFSGSSQQLSRDRTRFKSRWGVDEVPQVCLLSVCLIVKDEEELLAGCLSSIVDIADEIVVYDTGSSDSTVGIARGFGAKVIEGYWDNSFARARNAALSEASGMWVLSLDADERFLGDFRSVRNRLADRNSEVEAFLVSIENLHGVGNAHSVHTAIRLFRRSSGTWKHRLHEQVVAADLSGRNLTVGYLSGARIIHHGYAADIFDAKNKSERNLKIAELSLKDEGVSRPYALMNYGRALESAGRSDDAIEALKEAAEISAEPITKRLAVKNLIYILARLGRFDEALEQVQFLREISKIQVAADIAEGRVLISMGEIERGLNLLDKVPVLARDDEGMEYGTHMLAGIKGEALASIGRFGEASQVILDAIRSEGILEADLGELALWVLKAGRSPKTIAEAMQVSDLKPILGRLLKQPPEISDVILEGIWERFSDRLEPLAAAARIATKLPVARALVWSARLRRQELSSQCPLVFMACDEAVDPRARVLACAAAFGAFGDYSVVRAFRNSLSMLDEVQKSEALGEVGRIAPGLLQADEQECKVSDIDPGSNILPAPIKVLPSEPIQIKPLDISNVPRRGGVNIIGSFNERSVYGEVARNLAHSLQLGGIEISTLSYGSDGISSQVEWLPRGSQNLPFDVSILVLPPFQLSNFTLDYGVRAFEGRYMVGYWCWEYDRPSENMALASRMLHEIWTPSSFSANAIRQVTDRQVSRMLLPMEVSNSIDTLMNDFPEMFFLTHVDLSEGFERQNPVGTIEAYKSSFEECEMTRLIIGHRHSSKYSDEIKTLNQAISSRKDIVLIDEDVEGENAIFDRVAGKFCSYVSLYRSEGTGNYLAKAMGLGVPVIATDYSYSAELQSSKDSFLVSFTLAKVPDCEGLCIEGGRWAEPNTIEAIKFLRLVVEQPKLAMLRARRAQERYGRQFDPIRASKAIANRLRAIENSRHGAIAH